LNVDFDFCTTISAPEYRMSMSLRPTYIATGANRASSCSAITSSGTLAYGADRALAIWPTKGSSVQAALSGHQANITVVKSWSQGSEEGFISGDASGNIIIWSEKVCHSRAKLIRLK
jgi:hypothetical protein